MRCGKYIILTVAALVFLTITASAARTEEKKKDIAKELLDTPGDVIKTVAEPVSGIIPGTDSKKAVVGKTAVPSESTGKTGTAGEKTGKAKAREITAADLKDHIKMLLDNEDEVLASIPNLKKERGTYIYEGVRIEDIGKEKLNKLYGMVMNEVGRMRSERLNQQLQSIARAHQATMAVQQVARPPVIPSPPPQPPPALQPPPTPPSAQPQPYNPPQPQTPPPAPPRR